MTNFEAALEAGAKAMFKQAQVGDVEWEDLTPLQKYHMREMALPIVNAAVMAAQED